MASKYLGLIYCRRRRFAEAAECLARARDVLKDFDEEAAAAFAGRDLAGFAAACGRVEAEQMAVEALENATAVGDRWSIGRSLTTLSGTGGDTGSSCGTESSTPTGSRR